MECQLKSIPSSCVGIALISVTILPVLYIKLIPFLNMSNSISCCWSLLCSAILQSWADSLCLHVILREWLAAFFFFIMRFWISTAVGTGMAGATWNCCHLGGFCVHHTTMHCVTSCKVYMCLCVGMYAVCVCMCMQSYTPHVSWGNTVIMFLKAIIH